MPSRRPLRRRQLLQQLALVAAAVLELQRVPRRRAKKERLHQRALLFHPRKLALFHLLVLVKTALLPTLQPVLLPVLVLVLVLAAVWVGPICAAHHWCS